MAKQEQREIDPANQARIEENLRKKAKEKIAISR